MNRKYKQFCPHNHDTFICGRNKRGFCNICKKKIQKIWYRENKTEISVKRKQDYKTNRSNMIKINRDLPSSNFYKNRNTKLLHNFGITLKIYNQMFKKQKGKCALCHEHQFKFNRDLSVDRDHKTGKVRGLLCDPCNRALGLFKDNVKILKIAIKYLKK